MRIIYDDMLGVLPRGRTPVPFHDKIHTWVQNRKTGLKRFNVLEKDWSYGWGYIDKNVKSIRQVESIFK